MDAIRRSGEAAREGKRGLGEMHDVRNGAERRSAAFQCRYRAAWDTRSHLVTLEAWHVCLETWVSVAGGCRWRPTDRWMRRARPGRGGGAAADHNQCFFPFLKWVGTCLLFSQPLNLDALLFHFPIFSNASRRQRVSEGHEGLPLVPHGGFPRRHLAWRVSF